MYIYMYMATKYNQKLKIYYSGPPFPIVYSVKAERNKQKTEIKKSKVWKLETEKSQYCCAKKEARGKAKKVLKRISVKFSVVVHNRTEQTRIEWNGSGKPAQPSAPASALASGYIQSVRCGEELRISNSTILLAQTSRQATQN